MTTSESTPSVTTDPAEVKKVHDLMESVDIAMLTTTDSEPGSSRLVSRPLSTQVAEDGDILFLVRSSSSVAADVRANGEVNVAYASNKAWVSVSGTATVVNDRELVKELWSKGADAFMEGGPENQDNVVLKVNGDTATYWGGESLIGTAVKTIGAIRNKNDDDAQGGPTTVALP
ncbi:MULTISPECIES: pyridoxamine 5'-phosphate oxidase family protein [Kocuria]|uniref:Pyridoxamine 5'-phosphate oxidase family protein n=1 Tax=Kocuria subflava TaxID=1736139 RepID=A0A846U109_9MICC|nr:MULTISPECIES: pyridoxamine 5'-phosphate oxidase family protein [Kocuria]NKE10165.1 pyridoxamine 5'-phosphate oxidase family protein [Kocuria subflava]